MIMLTCMKNGNNQKKGCIGFYLAVVDGPLARVVFDAWDPSFRSKLERNTKSKLVIHY